MMSQRSSVGNERHRKSAKLHPDVAFRELESTRRLGETTQPNRNHECVSHRLPFSVASAFTPSRRLDLPPPHIGSRHTRFHILPRTYSSWALADYIATDATVSGQPIWQKLDTVGGTGGCYDNWECRPSCGEARLRVWDLGK